MENRSYDGTGNNLIHPAWGSVGEHLLRVTTPSYGDGQSALAGSDRPNPRIVSNAVCRGGVKPNTRGLSDFVWAWGQFLDHELDLTEGVTPRESADMKAWYSDPDFPNATIPFNRSVYDRSTGTSPQNPRQQINQLSSYIDAANVYGSNQRRALRLRTGKQGKLKINQKHKGLLPFNRFMPPEPNAKVPPGDNPPHSEFFLAGDIRANEHSVLTSMHTLFVREHNCQCDRIAKKHSDWNDEQIYQYARKIVGALMQVITYEEFLPALMGEGALSEYHGYNPNLRASISNSFSTAFYRLGHSMLSENITLVDEKGRQEMMLLREAFFKPALVQERGIDPFLRGLAFNPMQEIDTVIVESVRSFLFRLPKDTGDKFLDLAALNIQRGRDHGLPDYNQCRIDYGLPPVSCFAQITLDSETQQRLQSVYNDVDQIDPWLGALAEDHLPNAGVGQLTFTALKDQFERLRDGDRFWYENDPAFSTTMVDELRSTKLAAVIRRNTDIKDFDENHNLFIVPGDSPGQNRGRSSPGEDDARLI